MRESMRRLQASHPAERGLTARSGLISRGATTRDVVVAARTGGGLSEIIHIGFSGGDEIEFRKEVSVVVGARAARSGDFRRDAGDRCPLSVGACGGSVVLYGSEPRIAVRSAGPAGFTRARVAGLPGERGSPGCLQLLGPQAVETHFLLHLLWNSLHAALPALFASKQGSQRLHYDLAATFG